MSKEFSGVDFAIGSVFGHRIFGVNIKGELEPVSQSGPWFPGENVAVCKKHPSKNQVEPKRDDEEYSDYNKRIAEWRNDHDFEDCEHGFYAYFDGHDNGYTYNKMHVSGVIEAYGEVLVGTKGFRATKAKVVALSIAPVDGLWRLEEFVVDRLRANYPKVPIFASELAMRAEFPCPQFEVMADA